MRSKASRENKRENLEHGLLLMLFFSCKRKKIEQKSLFRFLHLCRNFSMTYGFGSDDHFVRLYCSTETGLMQSTDTRTRCSRDKDDRDGGSDEKKPTNKQTNKSKQNESLCRLFSPRVNHLFHSECRPSAARNQQEPDFCRPPTICFFFFVAF